MGKIEIGLKVSRKYLRNLKKRYGPGTAVDIVRSALAILSWAMDESAEKRLIVSCDKDGKNIRRLSMSELSRIRND